MSRQFGLNATGLDYSAVNVSKAEDLSNQPVPQAKVDEEPCCGPGETCCPPEDGLAQLGGANITPVSAAIEPGATNFVQGSADALGFDDSRFDGVTCECAVSTFSNQPQAATEFHRVLKSGGVFGMTDMVLNGELPPAFAEKIAPWTCMAKALTVEGYTELFATAGFELKLHEDHSHTLIELATEMKRKLVMAGLGKALGALPSLGMDLAEMRTMLKKATELVRAGTVQYGLLVFEKK